ncbi:MAG: hypothetical protein QW710_06540 [Pyrobaculum sp.]
MPRPSSALMIASAILKASCPTRLEHSTTFSGSTAAYPCTRMFLSTAIAFTTTASSFDNAPRLYSS